MNLIERVKGILVDPKAEWPRVKGEPGDIAYLFANYVAVLRQFPRSADGSPGSWWAPRSSPGS
jgi:hypothetical protein